MKTLMLYLNGDFDGGTTNFVNENQTLYMVTLRIKANSHLTKTEAKISFDICRLFFYQFAFARCERVLKRIKILHCNNCLIIQWWIQHRDDGFVWVFHCSKVVAWMSQVKIKYEKNIYRPPTKLRGSDIFSCVCLSVHKGAPQVTTAWTCSNLSTWGPSLQTWPSTPWPYRDGTSPPSIRHA